MSNFDYPWDKPEKQEEPAKTTPLVGGTPTQEELEQAVDDLFQEIYSGNWRFNK